PLRGLYNFLNSDPGAYAPGFMLAPTSQAKNEPSCTRAPYQEKTLRMFEKSSVQAIDSARPSSRRQLGFCARVSKAGELRAMTSHSEGSLPVTGLCSPSTIRRLTELLRLARSARTVS